MILLRYISGRSWNRIKTMCLCSGQRVSVSPLWSGRGLVWQSSLKQSHGSVMVTLGKCVKLYIIRFVHSRSFYMNKPMTILLRLQHSQAVPVPCSAHVNLKTLLAQPTQPLTTLKPDVRLFCPITVDSGCDESLRRNIFYLQWNLLLNGSMGQVDGPGGSHDPRQGV